jgi:hypothetical protein
VDLAGAGAAELHARQVGEGHGLDQLMGRVLIPGVWFVAHKLHNSARGAHVDD